MPDEEYIFRQAKRIYDDCASTQDAGSQVIDADGLADAYNDLLDRAQEAFPDNDIIQSLDEVEPSSRPQHKAKAVQQVRSNTSRLADALGIDVSELEAEQGDELHPINVTVEQDVDQAQQQAQAQQQQQYVDIDEVLEDIDRSTMPPGEKEELKDIVREFHEELEGDRDTSRLKRLLGRAEEYSVDVVAKLGILGLQYGVTGLITGSGSA